MEELRRIRPGRSCRSLARRARSATRGAACIDLDARYAKRYYEYAREAFGSDALADHFKSDVAWFLLTEGRIVASAGKWDHALSSLQMAAQHLLALQAGRLHEDCKVQCAYVHISKGELELAGQSLQAASPAASLYLPATHASHASPSGPV